MLVILTHRQIYTGQYERNTKDGWFLCRPSHPIFIAQDADVTWYPKNIILYQKTVEKVYNISVEFGE